jgi:ectoine hydroxylase-related dioxygenase (phytanoyl-CoA dioxygenase family)
VSAARQRGIAVKALPLRVLSPADYAHWLNWGYVVVRKAVPKQNLDRLRDLLWEFRDMNPADPASWYRPRIARVRRHGVRSSKIARHIYGNSGFINIYNHQYLWNNRQSKRVYEAFVDIWDRTDLWVTLDRANLNPPNRKTRKFGGFIHWDIDTTRDDLPMSVQGVLALADTTARMGGFQCAPDLFHDFDAWRRSQPAGRNPFFPDSRGLRVVSVPMRAGDLLIFNSLLAHGIKPNRSVNRARMAQYIAMLPADEGNRDLRARRVASWLHGGPSPGFLADPRGWERLRYPRARLSALGERLLGRRSWRDVPDEEPRTDER